MSENFYLVSSLHHEMKVEIEMFIFCSNIFIYYEFKFFMIQRAENWWWVAWGVSLENKCFHGLNLNRFQEEIL